MDRRQSLLVFRRQARHTFQKADYHVVPLASLAKELQVGFTHESHVRQTLLRHLSEL